jgi:hypothetical protein
MSIKYAVFLAALLIAAAVSAEACFHVCKHVHINEIPGCDLKAKACECFLRDPDTKDEKLGHKKYKVQVTDPVTGDSGGSSGYHKSKKLAAETAIYHLFTKDLGCNCHGNTSIPLGPCTYSGKACFYFTSVGALQNKQAAFKVFAQVVSPVASPVYEAIAPNATEAGFEQAGMQIASQVLSAYPQCLPTAQLGAKLGLSLKPKQQQ